VTFFTFSRRSEVDGASYKVKCVPRMTRASFSNSKYFLQWAHLTSGKPGTRLLEKLGIRLTFFSCYEFCSDFDFFLNLFEFEICLYRKFVWFNFCSHMKFVKIQILFICISCSNSKIVQMQKLFKFKKNQILKIVQIPILFIYENCSDTKIVQIWILVICKKTNFEKCSTFTNVEI
jgi:hypothetical protein